MRHLHQHSCLTGCGTLTLPRGNSEVLWNRLDPHAHFQHWKVLHREISSWICTFSAPDGPRTILLPFPPATGLFLGFLRVMIRGSGCWVNGIRAVAPTMKQVKLSHPALSFRSAGEASLPHQRCSLQMTLAPEAWAL